MSFKTKKCKQQMWGQPPAPVLSEVEGTVRPGKARLLLLAATSLLPLLVLLSLAALAQQSGLAKSPSDLPSGAMQAKATTACTECHEARIIVQQRLSRAAWTKEVDKMIKWGALVDANDHDALIDYLSMNFGVDQPQYQPPRSSSHDSRAQSK